MPVAADLIKQLPSNLPEDDVSTTGGARDASARPLDAQFSGTAQPEVVSDNAGDTQNCTIHYRDAAGSIQTQTQALTGTTPVLFNSAERILKIVLAATATGTITVAEGSGGTVRHTFAPGEDIAALLFYDSFAEASGGATRTRYEAEEFFNSHATESLNGAQVQITADPTAIFEMAVAGTQDDSETTTNRETAPVGETFVDDGVQQAVPGTDLAALSSIKVWIKQTLAAGTAAAKTSYTTEIAGTSV